jgi:hypothetical protein
MTRKCSVCGKLVNTESTGDYSDGMKKGIPFILHAGDCENTWRKNWPERYPNYPNS